MMMMTRMKKTLLRRQAKTVLLMLSSLSSHASTMLILKPSCRHGMSVGLMADRNAPGSLTSGGSLTMEVWNWILSLYSATLNVFTALVPFLSFYFSTSPLFAPSFSIFYFFFFPFSLASFIFLLFHPFPLYPNTSNPFSGRISWEATIPGFRFLVDFMLICSF